MSACENVTPAILESSNSLGLKPSVLAAPMSQLKLRPPKEEQVRGEQHSVLQEAHFGRKTAVGCGDLAGAR